MHYNFSNTWGGNLFIYESFWECAGSHDELLSRPDGAYTQLIRLQQVNKQQDADMYNDLDLDVDTAAIGRSLSKGSHGSRRRSLQRKSPHASRRVHDQLGKSGRSEGTDVESGDKENQKRADTSIFRLAKYSKPETPLFLIGSLAALANGTSFPIFGLLLSNIIAVYYITEPKKLRHDANFWSLMYLVLAIGIFIVSPIQFYSFGVIGQNLIRRLRRLTFEKVLGNEVAWFDEDNNGRWTNLHFLCFFTSLPSSHRCKFHLQHTLSQKFL